MSRPIAGVRNKTLLITLPGSPKGAKENLLAILKLLPHACQQAAGADSRSLHAAGVQRLERDAGIASKDVAQHSHSRDDHHHHHNHSHSHGHGGHTIPKPHTRAEDRPVSNDPSAGPGNRNRKSPFPIHSVDAALELITEHTPAPESVTVPVNTDICGHIIAEDVKADEAVPAFRASIVDGYAIIVSAGGPSTKGIFPVVSISHAAPGEIPELQQGQIARITTGAPLPPNANGVVMVEDTVVNRTTDDGKDEVDVEILTDQIKEGENVREVGSDIGVGVTILRKGEEISPVGGELGLLASVGKAQVNVYRKPIVGILSTGDEIVSHDRPTALHLGEVRDCNRVTLMAAVRGWGYKAVDLGIARDKYVICFGTSFSVSDTSQTRIFGGASSLWPSSCRRNHHLGRRFNGRARPAQANSRACIRRYHTLWTGGNEAWQAYYIRDCGLQTAHRRPQRRQRKTDLQSPWQSRKCARHSESLCTACAAGDERQTCTMGLAQDEGRVGRANQMRQGES